MVRGFLFEKTKRDICFWYGEGLCSFFEIHVKKYRNLRKESGLWGVELVVVIEKNDIFCSYFRRGIFGKREGIHGEM